MPPPPQQQKSEESKPEVEVNLNQWLKNLRKNIYTALKK